MMTVCLRVVGHLVFVSLLGKLVSTAEDSSLYSGHKLLRIVPQDGHQVQILMKLLVDPPNRLKGLDFWNEPSASMNTVDVVVDPSRLSDLELYLRQLKLPYSVVIPDLQSVIEAHALRNMVSKSFWRLSIYDSYLTYDEMTDWLGDATRQCGARCSLINIGRSYEGRPLFVMKITSSNEAKLSGSSSGPRTGTAARSSIWIDAGIHAREWISHATALYFIDRLISDTAFDSDVKEMLEDYDWYIMPCINPDGYQYSHTTNRLWRKTRSVSSKTQCFGVDANRNFANHWGSVGSSADPCSDLYRGPAPFSEPETTAMSNFILSRNGTWKLFLTMHAYGQKIMAPFGYTTNKPDNYFDLMKIGTAAKESIQSVYGTEYAVGSASDVLYRSSGTSRDWAAGLAKIPYVFTFELRDSGEHGFLLPADKILPTSTETWDGVKAMIRQINGLADRQEIVDLDIADILLRKKSQLY